MDQPTASRRVRFKELQVFDVDVLRTVAAILLTPIGLVLMVPAAQTRLNDAWLAMSGPASCPSFSATLARGEVRQVRDSVEC
ncbi:hypothetical protein MOTC310_08645 [Methylobacterium oryzae]|uniref:Uncharacterized protein n=1 Tax=Methylobacterium oryzae TaxID=334852 RepID=A0ABU7TLA7_9HYPH